MLVQLAGTVKYIICIFAMSLKDMKLNGDDPVMLVLWGMWSTPFLPLLPGVLYPSEEASERVLSLGQIELFDI